MASNFDYKKIFKPENWTQQDVEKAINSNLLSLCKNTTDFSHIITKMREEEIISQGEFERIIAIPVPFDRHLQFYTSLCKKVTVSIFETLLKAYDESAQHQLAIPLLAFKRSAEEANQPEPVVPDDDLKSVILVGPTGVGKSFICNLIFEAFHSKQRFKTSGNAISETSCIQQSNVNLGGNEIMQIVDTPGFYDTKGENVDRENICKIWKAMESAANISVILFVFNVRLSGYQTDSYKKLIQSIPSDCHANIIVVHNKFCGTDMEKLEDSVEIRAILKDRNVKPAHIGVAPNSESIKKLITEWVKFPTFSVKNLTIPEICYEREEESEIKERYIKDIEEIEMENSERAIDHSGMRVTGSEWDGFWKIFGGKRDKKEWVTDIQHVTERVQVKKTKQVWARYRDVCRIRFDGTKDFKMQNVIEYFQK